ncbi:7053_t:CDS:2 [Entrophospora sp. SA101]|nr:7053_t:CDS:2 [Entrophospora sp. SA101]
MRWCETPNELREFIENNKKISTTDSSSCASSPTLSVAGSPAGSTISTTSPTNTIYVYNVAARSSPSTYSNKHVYASSSSPSSKESSRSHHRHQPYSTKSSSKSNRKTSSFRRSNVKGNDHPHTASAYYYGYKHNGFSPINHNYHNYILNKGKGRGIYGDNNTSPEMSSLDTTPTLGQSSDTSSSDSTPPASPKHNNRSSSSFIIAKKQSRKKFNNVRRSSDINTITTNRQYGVTKNHGDSSSPIISERKRKSNSLARVMADRGLSEESIIPATSSTSTNSGEVKSIRIPPSPPLEYEKLIENLNNMNLENRILNTAEPNIIWKGQPLSITHLPHHDALHPKEAFVASALRLTPVQYLTAKHTLVSAAQRYTQRNFPFKKSDAQKLLRIDVNKASKLWEFFRQVEWI